MQLYRLPPPLLLLLSMHILLPFEFKFIVKCISSQMSISVNIKCNIHWDNRAPRPGGVNTWPCTSAQGPCASCRLVTWRIPSVTTSSSWSKSYEILASRWWWWWWKSYRNKLTGNLLTYYSRYYVVAFCCVREVCIIDSMPASELYPRHSLWIEMGSMTIYINAKQNNADSFLGFIILFNI